MGVLVREFKTKAAYEAETESLVAKGWKLVNASESWRPHPLSLFIRIGPVKYILATYLNRSEVNASESREPQDP
jgi:hypothetical protein